MKGQQIFSSFLPGVTAAVLATQSAWANPVPFTGVNLLASSSALTPTSEQISTAVDIKQVTSAAGNSLPATRQPMVGFIGDGLKLISGGNIEVILTGKTGIPVIASFANQVQGVLMSFKPTSTQNTLRNKIGDFATSTQNTTSTQQQSSPTISAGESKSTVFSNLVFSNHSTSKPASSIEQKTSLFGQVATEATEQKSPARLPKKSQNPTRETVDIAKLLEEVELCPEQATKGKTQVGRSASVFMKSSSCLQQNATKKNHITRNQVAQAGSPTAAPTPGAPTPPVPRTPIPTAPAPTGPVQIPNYLKGNPNPLQFPTKPEEVRVQGTQPITLAQALDIARRNNQDLQATLLTVESRRAGLRQQQAALLPDVSLSTNITRTGPSFLGQQTQTSTGELQDVPSTTNFSGSATITYPLYTSGQTTASIRQAEEQLRSAELDVERQSEVIRLDVTNQYYQLQEADENVRIQRSAVANAQASLRDAQALERAGVSTRFDVLSVQVDLANSQQDLTTALSNQRIARRRLAQLLSLPQSVDISTADPVGIASLWNLPLPETIILAFKNRPELQQNLAQRNIYEQQRRQALAGLGPQVSLVGRYSLSDQFDDRTNSNDSYSLAVQANLNLYDGGAARAQAAQAKANIRIAENDFARQRNEIRYQIENAYFQLQSNLDNIQTADVALENARQSLYLARLRFQAGVGTQTEVIDAQNRLTEAEGNRVSAILNYNRALANLQRQVTSRSASAAGR
ncbi:TolC family protein [Brasilonema sp. UFV-L1]|uniref:TolC family protein n=1 Tax=Brasilonema sp. UFV-L1 TaxID=2234130 RepID=UPI00145C5BA9|nr:TolC family protein [Brasilonema sp. UFV-L1]